MEHTNACAPHITRDIDVGDFPSGHTRHSKGWYEKVVNNPHIGGADTRNQALIGMSDGIPLFKHQGSKSVIPISLRLANQPDSISKEMRFMHLAGLYPCEFITIDKDTNNVVKENKKPSHITPLLTLLTDDLLRWYEGKMTVDHSLPIGSPDREFLLRVVLLFWCGDYPGLGEASLFRHENNFSSACHWCTVKSSWSKGLNRAVRAGFRRWLPHDDPMRSDTEMFQETEFRPPPAQRTHEEVVRQGIESDEYDGPANRHPSHETGVKGSHPFTHLHLWNMVRDFCLDGMHTVYNFHTRFLLPLLDGQRYPQKNEKNKMPSKSLTPEVFQKKMQEYAIEQGRYNNVPYNDVMLP